MTKILTTGGAGFIGSALCTDLMMSGYEVDDIDRARFETDDLADPMVFLRRVKSFKPDLVIHLAAQVGKKFCDDAPEQAVRDNITATSNVARPCGKYGIPLVYVSTSEVYGDRGDEVCFEDDKLFAKSSGMYANTKRMAEELARKYAPSGLKILRPTMPYGPGVPPGPGRRALDNLIWQALTGQDMVVHRGAARSWCWITDVIGGIIKIVEDGAPGIYNVGRDDDERTMVDLAMIIRGKIEERVHFKPEATIKIVEGPPNQTLVKRLSTAKLRALGWAPEFDLDAGLDHMIDWIDLRRDLWPESSATA